ncbi:MAG TPA: DUF6011 domain-containing protein [Glaciihabitans sp.]|jgi:hypothetical protein|nr:DUF6011 domain-containing protein [Glaciihabitans sp.]
MTERPAWLATDNQRGYILGLARQRVMPVNVLHKIIALCKARDFTKSQASKVIDDLKTLPLKPATVAAAPAARGAGILPGVELPIKFALPGASVGAPDELLFGEVKEYRGTRYVRVLRGAPGDFARIKPEYALARRMVAELEKDVVGAMRRFGTHFAVCGMCAAPLTDELSRARMFGPTCYAKIIAWKK